MKRNSGRCAAVLLLSGICLLAGCQKSDVTETETGSERSVADDAAAPVAPMESYDTEEGGDGNYSFGTDSFQTDSIQTDSFQADSLSYEQFSDKKFGNNGLTEENFGKDDNIDENFEKDNLTDRNFEKDDDTDENFGNDSLSEIYFEDAFYYTELTEEIRERITGKSYPDTGEPLQISYEDLAYVHVLHYDFQAQVQEGELICSQTIAQDLVDIFYELYLSQYPVEKICLIDEYDADDEASMADNNTSCFNYRTVPGQTKLSNHSYGYAIDINPLYNPYVRTRNGEVLVSPANAVPYADRSADFPHKIDKNDLCYKLFMEHGFDWGGAWNSSKDYQHFEKVP